MSRRYAIGLGLTLTVLSVGAVGAVWARSPDAVPVNASVSLDSVERFLAERYANFPDRVADLKLDLPALHARTEAALRSARNDSEVRRAIESLLAEFRDGHLRIQAARRRPQATLAGDAAPGISARTASAAVCRSWGYGSSRSRTAFSGIVGYETLPREGIPFERGLIRRANAAVAVLRIDSFGLEPHAGTCVQAWEE